MRFLNPDTLLSAVAILAVAIAIVVLSIYAYLFYKKRIFFFTRGIQKHLDVWITTVIMKESDEPVSIAPKFLRMLKNKTARQFTIDELILCKKNFSGIVAENITSLYIQLGLKKDSLKKLSTKNKWYTRARGIQELYLMNQLDVLKTIYKNTNSRNEFVRMEAQTGVIHLTGFQGLRFLDVISYPLTDWQQLKLLEQLRLHSEKISLAEKIPQWLLSANDSVIVFALRLADEFQEFAVRPNVVNCLQHPQRTVRDQAIKTLMKLADETTPDILIAHFPNESFINQVLILKALTGLATQEQADFLVKLLDHENDTIKLKAAVALAACSENGLAILEQKAKEQEGPYQKIYRHAKTIK